MFGQLEVVCWIIFFVSAAVAQTGTDRGSGGLVFAHFMVGIVSNRASAADWDEDIKLAKAAGIDAFALNIGVDPFTDTQLGYAYESAADNDFKVFISFDFNWFKPASDAATIGGKLAKFAKLPAQLRVNNKAFVSSFIGDTVDIATIRSTAGTDLEIVPNFAPGSAGFAQVDGAFNWMAWDSDGSNKAPQPGGPTVKVQDGDSKYVTALAGKPYLAPAAAWFSTHYGPEVSYSKNWVFPSDLLWYNRWQQLLTLKPKFIEMITWNDYGESHYIAPISSKHTDDGASKWINDMPHVGWLNMAKPFIAAYKAGDTKVDSHIQSDSITYWYRVMPKSTNCDATDTTMGPADNSTGNYFMGRPNGYDTLQDQVFVVNLLESPGTVLVNSGGTVYTFDAPAGASSFAVDFKLGAQSFSLLRNNQVVEGMSATSLKEISDSCPCGLYNYNAYVGSVPPTETDTLSGDGFSAFLNGLKAACNPTPSLPATPPATAAPTMTVHVTGGATSAPSTTPPPAKRFKKVRIASS